jgi:hypothetical protein
MTIDRKAIADELADQYKRWKRLIEGAIAEAALDPPDLRMTTEQLRYAWGAVTKRWGNAVKRIEPASMANAAGGASRYRTLGSVLLSGHGGALDVGGLTQKFMIRWIRHKHRIPGPSLPAGTFSVSQVRNRYGVSMWVVYYWIDRASAVVITSKKPSVCVS